MRTWTNMNHMSFVSFISYFYEICTNTLRQCRSPSNLLDRKNSDLITLFMSMKYKAISPVLRRYIYIYKTEVNLSQSRKSLRTNSMSWIIIFSGWQCYFCPPTVNFLKQWQIGKAWNFFFQWRKGRKKLWLNATKIQ